MIAFVLTIAGVTVTHAQTTCVADTSPGASCDSLSLATQYIDANVGSSVTVTSTGTNTPAVQITATQNSFTNSGTLEGTSTGAQGLRIEAAVTTLTNTGSITGYSDSVGVKLMSTGSVATLDNSGQITGGSSNAGLTNFGGTITTLNNAASGSITSTYSAGIFNTSSGTITTIANSGTISGSNFGINNASGSSIDTITNLGTITGGTAGIQNSGTLSTLNNLQGSSSALTYKGTLPTSYNIVINSTSNYGKLEGSGLSGSVNFGIYAGSTVTTGTYSSVLSGFSASNITTTTGTYNSYPWLLNNSTGSVWDLIIGLSTTDTQTSVNATAVSLNTLIAMKNSTLVSAFQYDCPISQDRRVCLGTGSRYTHALKDGTQEFGSALIFAVRTSPRTRLGLYADQTLDTRWSGTSIDTRNHSPLLGGFIDWKRDATGGGPEIRLSVGYEKNTVTITRSGTGYSEAGSGSTEMMSRGAQLSARYGFNFRNGMSLSPYVGIRRVQHWLEGYEENGSSLVTTPLTYSSVSAIVTTALAGMSIDVPVNQQARFIATAGLEYDVDDNYAQLVASGMTGLSAVSLDSTTLRQRGKLLMSYHWLLNARERLMLTGIYQQEAYAGFRTARLIASYDSQF